MTDPNDLELPSLQGLQSAEQMELLDVVDSLRACGLSEIVALPQLIVCGDQSSGKSSVLEAISGIPFPRQDDLCTRFATEVILRRAPTNEISVSIVPGKARTQVDRDRLQKFRHDLKSREDFRGLFEFATTAMGLSSAGKSFSNDVLRVEFCGPSQPQLTLVDLPGLIHTETKSQIPADVELVHGLVSEYLRNPRSIILAVVSAKNDIGNQIILRKAREFDPKGVRTLGIITKPDLLAKGSKSEESFIALARNEDVKFSLGWHVVKNLDLGMQNGDQVEERDKSETRFFQDSSFNRLPTHTTGISFLRERLSKVLFKQIQTELPRLVDDIQSQIASTKSAQDRLGPSRKEPSEQRSFLISLSQMFQTICRDAVRGDYDHDFFHADDGAERRLCANVMNMHFDFAHSIRKDGASWLVDDKDADKGKYRSREAAIKEACVLLKRSRGRELPGLPNPLLVGELFRQYSRPWEDIARAHIKRIWEATMGFLELLLRELTDDDACENVLRFLLYPAMEERLTYAYGKLDELLEVHKDYPMTTNSQFLSQRQKQPEDKSNELLEDPLLSSILQSGKKMDMDELRSMLSTRRPTPAVDMDMVAAEEAFDNMNAYYEVAMNLFTDNVPTLAIQGPIIREVPKIFCPTAVDSMEADLVKRIAGETDEKIQERDEIVRKLQALEKGARICKLYAKRPRAYLSNASQRSDISELTSTPKHSPDSDTDKRTTPNIFGRIATPSQRTTPMPKSPQSRVSNKKSEASVSADTATSTLSTTSSISGIAEITSTKQASWPPKSNLFDSSGVLTQASSPFSGFINPSPGTPLQTTNTKPNSGGLFGGVSSTPSAGGSFGGFGSAALATAQSGSGLFGKKPTAPTGSGLFSTVPGGSSFGASPLGSSSTATDVSRPGGLFTFPSAKSAPAAGPASTSSKHLISHSTTSTSTTSERIAPAPTTIRAVYSPYIESETNSLTQQKDVFTHICFLQMFQKYSCEELRIADYECMARA